MLFVALLTACSTGPLHRPADTPILTDPHALPGTFAVMEMTETFHDAARQRDVPVKIYAPSGSGPFPLIIFSHGLGSSRNGYAYLGKHWASHGFVVVHPQHQGSDSEVVRTRGRWAAYRSAYEVQQWIDRPADASFAIDELQRRDADARGWPLAGKIDFRRIGAGGHSYGAHTVLALAGLLVNLPHQKGRSFHDPRVKAVVSLSSPPMNFAPTEYEYSRIDLPVMNMTGTRDASLTFRTTHAHRRRPFERIHRSDQYLITIDGAVHRTFADLETIEDAIAVGRLDGPPGVATRPPGNTEHQQHLAIIRAMTLAFWQAYLQDDAGALRWLRDGAASRAVSRAAKFESR
jgi:predicted dienelactone hydrolase